MLTICPNEDCNQKYKIKPELIGSMGRCKKCNNIFILEEFKEKPKIFELGLEEDETHEEEAPQETRKRRSPKEIMKENIALIKYEVNDFLPRLNKSLEKQESESDTRLLINKMLQKILGYNLEDIKTEQKIEGRRADYALYISNMRIPIHSGHPFQ